MIHSIGIEGFRGIRRGGLDKLFRLSVLLGPNNSGKSTCLEALWLTAATSLEQTALDLLRRRGWLGTESLRLLVPDRRSVLTVRVTRNVQPGDDTKSDVLEETRRVTLEFPVPFGVSTYLDLEECVVREDHVPVVREVRLSATASKPVCEWTDQPSGYPLVGAVLVEPHVSPDTITQSLKRVDEASEQHHRQMIEHLRVIDPDLLDVRVVASGDEWIPRAMYRSRSVPLAVSGDGMKRLFCVASVLAVAGDGLGLIEEPECFQHPKSIEEMVKVIWSAVDSGTQVVLSTHSLELLDLLLAGAQQLPGRLEQFGVFRLALDDGELRSTRVPGPDVVTMRQTFMEDLRR